MVKIDRKRRGFSPATVVYIRICKKKSGTNSRKNIYYLSTWCLKQLMFPSFSASFVRGKDNGHVGRHNGHPTSNVGPISDRKSCLTFALLILPLHTPTFTTIILPPPSLRDRMSSSVPSLMMEVKKEADYEHELFFSFHYSKGTSLWALVARKYKKQPTPSECTMGSIHVRTPPRPAQDCPNPKTSDVAEGACSLACSCKEGEEWAIPREKKREEGAHSRFSLLLPTFQGPTTGMGEDFFKEEEGHCQGQHERRLARDYRRGSSRDR